MPKRGIHLRNLDIEPLEVFQGELAYTAGRYYMGSAHDGNGAQTVGTIADRLRTSPIYITRNVKIDRLGVHVITAQASGSTRFGIYESDSDGLPDKLVIDAGTIDSTTTGFKEITVDVTLRGPRIYWAAFVQAVNSVDLRGHDSMPSMGVVAGGDVTHQNAVSKTHTFGVLPDPYGTPLFIDIPGHFLYMRVV